VVYVQSLDWFSRGIIVDRLLEKYGLTNCNHAKVPMCPDIDLAGLPISPLAKKTTMQSTFCTLVDELITVYFDQYKARNQLCSKSMLARHDKSHQGSL
jgi:hypothetical protein